MQSKDEGFQLFVEKVPWIATTPSRTAASVLRTDQHQQSAPAESGMAPQSVQPPAGPQLKESVEDNLSAEEKKLLENLRGIQGVLALPEQLQVQFQELEQKEQRALAAKTLSHGHLNKLNKLKTQVAAGAKRVQDMDQEWRLFMSRTLEKVRQHALLYQQARADLLEAYNYKVQELETVKAEVSQASQSLVSQPWMQPLVETIPEVRDQMEELQKAFSEGGLVSPLVDLTDHSVEEVGADAEMEEDAKTLTRKASPLAMKPFRSATSPSGVAKTHLKIKDSKADTKTKDHKETKE